MPGTDAFSATLNTWIIDRAEGGPAARAELNRHMMEVYAQPLRIYFRGTSYRSCWEADEVVNGFFAHCLQQADYFRKWKESGMLLRRWLMNGLCLYCRSKWKIEFGPKRAVSSEEPGAEAPADEGGQKREFARAFARAALELARGRCEGAGLGAHYEAFVLYYVHERSCRQIGAQLGQDESRVWVMILTAKRHFTKAVREVLVLDGVPQNEIDDELGDLA